MPPLACRQRVRRSEVMQWTRRADLIILILGLTLVLVVVLATVLRHDGLYFDY